MEIKEALAFNDVLIIPRKSILSSRQDADLSTELLGMEYPIMSSNMDTVTESKMAKEMARYGGIGIIHRYCSIEEQVNMVKSVKNETRRSNKSCIIPDPYSVRPNDTIFCAKKVMSIYKIGSLMVTNEENMLVGILTTSDIQFCTNISSDTVKDYMTTKLITSSKGKTLEDYKDVMKKYKIKKLPLISNNGFLEGLVCSKDIILKEEKFPNATKDFNGRLKVGAAVGLHDYERIEALVKAEVDTIVIDVAHGHCDDMIETIKKARSIYPDLIIGAGNVATKEGFIDLAEAGANWVKTSIGSGCFSSNTKVLMANGTYKNINEVKVGEYVKNMNDKSVRVKGIYNQGFKEVIQVKTKNWNELIYVTPNHRYWICNKDMKFAWKEIGKIEDGDHITSPFELSEIQFINNNGEAMEVFDIEVDCPTHSFIANGSIVHNSICKTRIVTGAGVPTFQALLDIRDAKKDYPNTYLVADGGIKTSGDMAKSIGAGADAIMVGSLLAGTEESPGSIIVKDGKNVKIIRGMAGIGANWDKKKDKTDIVPEGVEAIVDFKGPVWPVLTQLMGGLKSAMSYSGTSNLKDMQNETRFYRQTMSGIIESNPHSVKKI